MKQCLFFFLFILSLLVGCSGLEKSEREKVRARNLTIRPIERQSDEFFFEKTDHPPKKRAPYPWEGRSVGGFPRITKEFFRCQGNLLNPPIQILQNGNVIYHLDCGGIEGHSLPLKEGKEFIYPILIDLLNHVQKETGKRVVITCGHRCPTHNLYADPSKQGRTSKHLVGAEVDFYVEGLEHSPQTVIDTLLTFPQNKEAVFTIVHESEGRDYDNNHPYPYITIEVRYDRESHRPVSYNWHQAHNGYIKR